MGRWIVMEEFGLTPFDVHIPREEPANGTSPGDAQNTGKTPTETHGKFGGRSKAGLFAPRIFRVRRRKRNTSTKKSLDEATNAGRVDIDGKTGKEKRSGESTCAELVGDGADEAVDLVETEDNVMLIGEVAVILVALVVSPF
jgi:hypothetical protein